MRLYNVLSSMGVRRSRYRSIGAGEECWSESDSDPEFYVQ